MFTGELASGLLHVLLWGQAVRQEIGISGLWYMQGAAL